ncbi:hypothetical protein ACFRCQ_25010 [Cytobacillus firmus]|uniref:hypothetical protein n=1 Tax=Cytobacillus firmus TaxID=1399 RepID=UPI00369A9E37
MDKKKDLEYLIEKILTMDEFWEANYYFRCMKKQPHGGVARIFTPNIYLKHYPAETFVLFVQKHEKKPYFLRKLVDRAFEEFLNCNIDIEELLWLCFDDDSFWYVGFRLLKPKKEYEDLNKEVPLIWNVISAESRFQDYFEIELKTIVYVLICYLIKSKMISINGIQEIRQHEQLMVPHNKYGLTLTNEATYLRQGFIINERYYLYNLFFDTTIGNPIDQFPYTIKIIEEINDRNVFMRCDEKLSVPKNEMVSTATMDFQKYRGISVDFASINELVYKKEIVVHFDPVTNNKVLMMIKPDTDKDLRRFYHFEVEELWNPNIIKDDFVITNYIHAQYYPDSKGFNHIDFSVNQYSKEVYEEKFKDSVTDTGVTIDRYGEEHYKIWCVESHNIDVETWGKLVLATLDEPFRHVFTEMFQI